MVPYKDNGHLTDPQKYFNKVLSSCRVHIEHAFGILKQRFRQLYYCKLKIMKIICHFARACCVLHNLANKNDIEVLHEPMVDIADVIDGREDNGRGRALRDELCRQLCIEHI